MPVHSPGPRLFRSIPFKYLAQKGGDGGSLPSNININVTPFVDMMTILVTFLLMTFSASGEILTAQKGLTLPNATQQKQLRRAPIVTIARDAITFNGKVVGDPEDTAASWKIDQLFEEMKHERKKFDEGWEKRPDSDPEKVNCINPKVDPEPHEICLMGLAILQADERITAKVLNRVLKTADAAGYKNLLFAVNRKGPRGN